ncbi:MAG: hypothetical protein KDK64_01205, partial [Chlamydiia bacterium]|nr:hypothetical protein [Chlamydiia bacterium]
QLVREKLVEVRPYLTQEIFDQVKHNQAARTFLIRMGYHLPLDQRPLYAYDLATAIPLEQHILEGNIAVIKELVKDAETLEELERTVEALQVGLPHFRTTWIWRYVLEGYLEASGKDFNVIRRILAKDLTAQEAMPRGGRLLTFLSAFNRVEARKLCEEKLIDPTPYFSEDGFQHAEKAERTFLLQVGYAAKVPERQGKSYDYATANPLEPHIVKGEVDALKQLLQRNKLAVLDEGLKALQEELPLLKTDWIWPHVLEGYCAWRRLDDVDVDTMLSLLNRAKTYTGENPVEALNQLQLPIGEGSLLEKLVSSGRADLAKCLVDEGFCKLKDHYDESTSKSFAWFAVQMGYPQLIHGTGQGDYQVEVEGNLVEAALITCDVEGLKALADKEFVMNIVDAYRVLSKGKAPAKPHFPHLRTPWAWEALAYHYWEIKSYDEFLYLVNEGLFDPHEYTPGTRGLAARNRKTFFDEKKPGGLPLATTEGEDAEKCLALLHAGYVGEALFTNADGISPGFLTVNQAIMFRDKAVIRYLAETHGFDRIYRGYLEVKELYPCTDLKWMWDALFTIPSSHFAQYASVMKALEVPPPPEEYPLTDLVTLFDKIDFSTITDRDLTDTTGGGSQVRTQRELREAAGKVASGVEAGNRIYQMTAADQAKYKRQLRWIIHYLKQDLGDNQYLSERAGRIYARMFLDCLVCHSRYNEVFDWVRRSLGNLEVSFDGFEDQLQIPLGEHRSHIVALLTARGGGSTHTHDNLVHNLKVSRGLPNDAVHHTLGAAYARQADAERAFDAEYSPGVILEVLYSHMRSNGDFYDLVVDQLGNRLAPRWHGQDQDLRKRVQRRGVKERLPLQELARDFKWMPPREEFSFKELVAGLGQWGLSLEAYVAAKQKEIDEDENPFEEIYREAAREAKQPMERALKEKWIAYGKAEGRGYFKEEETADTLTGQAVMIRIMQKDQAKFQEVGADFRRGPAPQEVLGLVAKHFEVQEDMTLEAFYQKHPEIPEVFHAAGLKAKMLSDEAVKVHLVQVAYQMKYEIAPLELGQYLQAEEVDVFIREAIPMDREDVPRLREKLHPLVLAKLLVDMEHLESRVPGMYEAVFSEEVSAGGAPVGRRRSPEERRVTLFKMIVLMAALYGGYRWSKSSIIGSPKWFAEKIWGQSSQGQKV